jgi:hypothetical protein
MGEKVKSAKGRGEPGEGRQLVNVVAVIVTMAEGLVDIWSCAVDVFVQQGERRGIECGG